MIVAVIVALIMLAALGIVAVFVLRQRVGRTPSPSSSEGLGVRRFFQYLVLYGLLIVSSWGLAGLLTAAIPAGTGVSVDDNELARSVAFSTVGVPMLVVLVAWVRRTAAKDDSELGSFAVVSYLTAATLTSLGVTMIALHDTATWLVGLRSFEPSALANALVWTPVWAVHQWVVVRRVEARTRPLHHLDLAGSLVGLVIGALGLGRLLSGVLETWFGLTGPPLVAGHHDPIREGAVTLLVGSGVWTVYWLRRARRSTRDQAWHAYVLLAGMAGGLLVALVCGSLAIFRVAVWFVGTPRTDDAARYFESLPSLVAGAVVAMLSVSYHRDVLHEVANPQRTEVDRVRDYLLAGIGLAAAAAGSVIAQVALIEAVVDAPTQPDGGVVNTLLAAATLLVVGAPVWWWFWHRAQAAATRAPEDEAASPTRRTYLLVLLGLSSVAALGALLVGTYVFLEDLLEGLSVQSAVQDVRYPVGVLVTAGAVAAYHWKVYRAELGTVRAGRPPARFVLLLGVGDAAMGRSLAGGTHGTVLFWSRTDQAPGHWSEAEVREALLERGAAEQVVLEDGGRLRTIPVQRQARVAPAVPPAPGRPPGNDLPELVQPTGGRS